MNGLDKKISGIEKIHEILKILEKELFGIKI